MGSRHVQGWTAGAENATWPHASILARTAQRREHVGFWRPLWWSARRQLFGHSPGHGRKRGAGWRETKHTQRGKRERKAKERSARRNGPATRSPPQSGACRRSPCRRRPNATGSGRCLYAGSIHRSVFRARVLAGLPAPHAGTGSGQQGRGTTRTPPLTRTTGCAGLSVSDGDVRH